MTGRGAAVQGALAAAGLVAAYFAWQKEPAPGADEVIVVDANKNDLQSVRYQDGAQWTELSRRAEPGGAAAWLKVSARAPAPPPATKSPDGGAPAPATTVEPGTPERELRASELGAKALDKFAPLRAARALGVLDAPKLKELGLDAAKRSLTIATRAGTRRFALGSPAAGGETYMKDDADGKVYLLARQASADLDATGTRFTDRTLHVFKLGDVKSVALVDPTGAAPRVSFAPIAPESPTPRLARAATPDKADELASNWHEKVWRLFPNEVLGRNETPRAGEPKVKARVEYELKSGAPGFIDLAVIESASTPPAPEVYARTEHSAGWLKLPASMADLVAEAAKVASQKP